VEALVGRIGVVSEAIEPGTGRGRVLVEGEDWRGTSLDERVLPAGTKVSVIQVDGTQLVVEKEPDQ
jgi:membrane protein implicated in regulation of membrane protease activity